VKALTLVLFSSLIVVLFSTSVVAQRTNAPAPMVQSPEIARKDFAGGANVIESQLKNLAGKYVYKNYRKGKGGFENQLEITNAARGRLHISFEGTYFFMAGRDETFHEGSGKGDGPRSE